MLSAHGWSIVIVLAALVFLVAVDRGFSSFKITTPK